MEFVGKFYPHTASWVVKVSLDLNTSEVRVGEPAVMLKNEYVSAICEFAPSSLLIACLKTKNLVLAQIPQSVQSRSSENSAREIVSDEENDNKNWIAPLPEFDPTDIYAYPFLVCAGDRHISLINIKDGKCQKLINSNTRHCFSQPGALIEKEGNVLHLAFPS